VHAVARPAPLLRPAALVGLVRRPDLWFAAAVVAWRLIDPRWWRQLPGLPRLPPAYQAMRREAMFGSDSSARLSGTELVAYIEWCARMAKLAR
jgi:hypothetical protein